MKSSTSIIIAAVALLSSSIHAADLPPPDYKTSLDGSYIGCYKPGGDLQQVGDKATFQSSGACRTTCTGVKAKYSALTKKFLCYCGNSLPPVDSQLPNDECNINCPGYPSDPCGSLSGDLTIFLTDATDVDDRLYDPSKAPTSSSSTSSPSTTTTTTSTKQGTGTSGASDITTTSANPTSSSSSSSPTSGSSGVSKAGAAAGAVVGVLVAGAISVGAFLFIRKQRRKKIEDEYRRSIAVREYQKKPEADLRLDPTMLQRRMSDGSIADNHDYSRRILKVTNPDGM